MLHFLGSDAEPPFRQNQKLIMHHLAKIVSRRAFAYAAQSGQARSRCRRVAHHEKWLNSPRPWW